MVRYSTMHEKTYSTHLSDVEWSSIESGLLTPKAVVRPHCVLQGFEVGVHTFYQGLETHLQFVTMSFVPQVLQVL